MSASNRRNHPHIEMLHPDVLRVPKSYARKDNPKHTEQIARAHDQWGFINPIIANDDGDIVIGVVRWKAAVLRRLDAIPVIRAKFVSEAAQRAFALADNRLAEFGEFDSKLLTSELTFLFDQDYDFSVIGFDLGDLDLGVVTNEPDQSPVELPTEGDTAVSRIGDLWSVGPHRLYNGNARHAESYETLLSGELARMVFADLPYNVPVNGHITVSGKAKRREFAEASGEMSQAEFTAFQRSIFKQLVQHSVNGSIHYQCMDFRHMRELLDVADGVYTEFKQLAVWVKNNGGMGAFLRARHELVFIFKSGRSKHVNNVGLSGKGNRYRTNVWEYAGANTFRKGRAKVSRHMSRRSQSLWSQTPCWTARIAGI